MKQQKIIIFSFLCLFLLSFTVYLSISDYSQITEKIESNNSTALDAIDSRMKDIFSEINNFPASAADDVLFLSRLSSFKDLTNFEHKEADREKIENDLTAFLKQSSAYHQVRYINELDEEVVRVDFDGQHYEVIQSNELQNEQYSYYFQQTMDLGKGEIFVSELDLNVEDGKIENQGTQENPQYIPVIRYATPVFNDLDEYQGIVIVNVYADYFLEDIERSQREGEITFLINNEGYYLAHPQKEKEFSFMFADKDDNLAKDYPKVANKIIKDCSNRRVETSDRIFTYRCIYPLSSTFAVYEGTKELLPNDRGYHWILVTVTDKESLEKVTVDYHNKFLWLMGVYGIFVVIVVLLVHLFGTEKYYQIRKKKNR